MSARKKLKTSRTQRLGKRVSASRRKANKNRTSYQKYKKTRTLRLGKRS